MPTRSALLLGASGLIGGFCLDALLKEAAYDRIIILSRRHVPRSSPKIFEHIIDFGKLKEYAGLMAANDIFCCLGTTIKQAGSQTAFHLVDCTYPLEIARLGLEQGARQFLIVTAMGADPHSRVFYNRVKGEVEEKLSHLGYFGLHIFRPSLLLGKHHPPRPAEDLAQLIGVPLSRIMIGPLKKYRPVEAKAVADAMVRTAQKKYQGIFIYPSDRIAQL